MEIQRAQDAPPESPDSASPAFTILGPRRAWVSPAIIAVNAIVFAAMVASGVSFMSPTSEELLRFGADHGPLVADGEWWRLLTSAFVHVGILHIAFNMWVFRSLGPAAERLFGNAAFALLYVASALGASVASILWNPAAISAGASGAIFGVAGAFLAFFLGHRRAMPPELFRTMTKSLVTFVAINALFGFMVPGIDNAAHLGGLATGFLAGVVLNRDIAARPVLGLGRAVRATLLFAVLLALGALVPWRVRTDSETGPRLHLSSAQRAIAASDWPGVLRIADEWIALRPDDGLAWQVRGMGHLKLGDKRTAREDFDRAISFRDDLPYALSTRSFLRYGEGDVAGALRDYDAVVELLPDDAWHISVRAHLRYDMHDWAGSLRDFQTVMGLDPKNSSAARIYVWIVRSRLEQRTAATAELQGALEAHWEPDERRIAAFLLGSMSEEELSAELPSAKQYAAHYFCGIKRLLDGDREGAKEFFERCLEIGEEGTFETMHAQTELDLLAK